MAQEAFNAFALEYDNAKYLPEPAKRTAENAGLKKGKKVLDVACGTGWATIAAARLVSDTGFVTGIDIADQLLTLAKAKATAAGLKNIKYFMGNAESLEFDDNTFDAVICASSIFIFQDPTKALCEWYRVLKPGGNVIFSVFGEEIFQPVFHLYIDKLIAFGKGADFPKLRFTTPEECLELLSNAGYTNNRTITEQLGFYFPDKDDCWNQLSNSLAMKPHLKVLSPEELERFKKEHFEELESLVTDKGIWIDLSVHFGLGEKLA